MLTADDSELCRGTSSFVDSDVTTDDKNEQQGVMFLFAGAAAWLRNSRVHNLDQDTAVEAWECLVFLGY